MDEARAETPSWNVTSPRDVADLLAREDLPLGSPNWWEALVARCNTGLVLGDEGVQEALDWGHALIETLDRAHALGALPDEKVIHRRTMASAALISYFGTSSADPSRDPKAIIHWFVRFVGRAPEEIVARRDAVVRELADSDRDVALLMELAWFSSLKAALEDLEKIAAHDALGEWADEAIKWSSVRDRL